VVAHRLVAAAVDEVGAEHTLAVANERVVTVPIMHPKSASKLSVMVYRGFPIPSAPLRRAVSVCGALANAIRPRS
jgi:hypothetical protein